MVPSVLRDTFDAAMSACYGPECAEIDDLSLKHGGGTAEPPALGEHLDISGPQ